MAGTGEMPVTLRQDGGEMPSETIHCSDNVNVRVAWGSNEEGLIQVATLRASGDDGNREATDALFLIVNEWLEQADMPQVDVAELRKRLAYTPFFDGWHATLNSWSDTNRLIGVLKRARDKAFGSPA